MTAKLCPCGAPRVATYRFCRGCLDATRKQLRKDHPQEPPPRDLSTMGSEQAGRPARHSGTLGGAPK